MLLHLNIQETYFEFKECPWSAGGGNKEYMSVTQLPSLPHGAEPYFAKPPTVQLLKNFPEFYGTRRFITVFTRALHWSLS
jgi:hypothetical protein